MLTKKHYDMKLLKFTFALFLASFVSFSFAQEKPFFVIEDNGVQYDVFLKIENIRNISAVDILGNYSNNGEVTSLAMNINKADVSNFKNNVVLVHSLNKEINESSASYMVLLTNKKGVVTSYPLVTVNLSSPGQLASNL